MRADRSKSAKIQRKADSKYGVQAQTKQKVQVSLAQKKAKKMRNAIKLEPAQTLNHTNINIYTGNRTDGWKKSQFVSDNSAEIFGDVFTSSAENKKEVVNRVSGEGEYSGDRTLSLISRPLVTSRSE